MVKGEMGKGKDSALLLSWIAGLRRPAGRRSAVWVFVLSPRLCFYWIVARFAVQPGDRRLSLVDVC